MELQPDDGLRSSLGIGPGSDDAVEPRREFARRFAEGIEKLAGNTLGDRWKKTIGLTTRMPKAAGLGGMLLPYRFGRRLLAALTENTPCCSWPGQRLHGREQSLLFLAWSSATLRLGTLGRKGNLGYQGFLAAQGYHAAKDS
ncbi:hypothetical protein BHE74_00016669 [Ensete ventricosum]|nr:hypothetical protein BHE74_00016669 [Ensete ventricosum]RZS20285.1 hypothetical protein BHM03_00052780 [Ensete ventricosum]